MPTNLTYYFFMIPAILISLSVHEYFHALAADRLGDPTPRSLGRLTLNPLRHLDPLGALAMILFRIGWAKPVPVNTRYFRKPRRDMALTAVAGPLSNLLLSFFSSFLLVLFEHLYTALLFSEVATPLLLRICWSAFYFFYLFHVLNLSLFLFNLLPVTPLDGSRILGLFLPAKAYYWLMRHERQIYLVVLFWLLFGARLANILLRIDFISSSPVLYHLVSVLSLTGWIGSAVDFLSNLMIRLWGFLPFPA